MSMNYSFKHNFHYPFSNPGPTPVNPLQAAEIPHHPMQYNYHHYRAPRFRRFGLFRRFFWFGLGVGAANWYIYHKQRQLESGSDERRGWGHWRGGCSQPWISKHDVTNATGVDNTPSTNPQTIPASPLDQVEHRGYARWSPKTKTIHTPGTSSEPPAPVSVNAVSTTTDDLVALRETVDRILAEKKREMVEVQAKAGVEAKEYAREKLDRLSTILEGLRESLKLEQNVKEEKLV